MISTTDIIPQKEREIHAGSIHQYLRGVSEKGT